MASEHECPHGRTGYCHLCWMNRPPPSPCTCTCKAELAQLRVEIRELREELAAAVKIRFVDE